MADPKYADLPGIDVDSRDVFETSDLPESEQCDYEQEEGSECVEKIDVSVTDAFSKFKTSSVLAGELDFSDRISVSRRTGYDVQRTEYEILGDEREAETPLQRYQRLQHEIRELSDDVAHIKEGVSGDAASSSGRLSPVQLTRQVEYLQHQLSDLHLDKLLGADSQLNLADPHAALQKRLMTELSAYKPDEAKVTEGSTPAPGGKDLNHVTYQLYYRPEQAKFSSNARMADVEQRLERLEAVVGSNPERLSTLTTDTNNKSLVGAIAVLSGKTRLLEPAQLDQIEGRLNTLGQKLTQISEKKEAIENSDKTSKVNELYELIKKWDAVVDTLPHVVDRLTALKDLHEQALQFSQALAHLDTAQQQITGQVNAHTDMVKQVESTLSENMKTIKENSESLNGRIKSLK